MASLLEATAAMAISGALLSLVTGSMTATARLQRECVRLTDELFQARQLEHLVDRAALAAGSGPNRPAAVSSVEVDAVGFASDHDGDGVVDATSSETTTLEVRQEGATARVRIRLGRQTMTVLEAARHDASLVVLDRRGAPADAASASLVELRLAPRDGDAARSWRFSVPAWPAPP